MEPVNHSDVKIQETQKQVNEVINIMQDNVRTVVDRGVHLDDLNSRADNLASNANQFSTTATAVRKKYFWKNIKWMIIAGLVVLLVIVIIIITSVSGGSSDDSGNSDNSGN